MCEVAKQLRRVLRPDGHVFVNIGFTLIAARNLCLSAIGIEIDPNDVAAAWRRLGQVVKEAPD
jgi:hypothetical protein